MVLGGSVNKEIVSLLNRAGGQAVGLSGKDGRFVRARKLSPQRAQAAGSPPEILDPGRVGEVERVDPRVIATLEDGGYIPVIAPVGVDADGRALNINADTVAGEVAAALGADRLLLLTDVEGVKDGSGALRTDLRVSEAEQLIRSGVAQGGMVPKLRCCLDALSAGVQSATILDGRVEHAVLLELFTDRGVGTVIRRDEA
ncbi:MAG: acetylglutamate kinase, partial [Deltaproteobacteria bacterium]